MSDDKFQLWSCGGGTQSIAIGILILQGRLPKPDACVICDTGRETESTWEYLDAHLNPALASIGLEVLRIKADEWSSPRADGIALFGKSSKDVLIPVYSTLTGQKSKFSNFCTELWKVEPIQRWLSNVLGITRSRIMKWIGFSRDEQRRIVKMMTTDEFKKGLIRFPLLETGFSRRESIQLVENFGWPTPPRSACWCCPNKSDHEWRLMKQERPDEFQKAVSLEKEIQSRDEHAWLHKSCEPLDKVNFDQPEDLFSRPCDSGVCFV